MMPLGVANHRFLSASSVMDVTSQMLDLHCLFLDDVDTAVFNRQPYPAVAVRGKRFHIFAAENRGGGRQVSPSAVLSVIEPCLTYAFNPVISVGITENMVIVTGVGADSADVVVGLSRRNKSRRHLRECC